MFVRVRFVYSSADRDDWKLSTLTEVGCTCKKLEEMKLIIWDRIVKRRGQECGKIKKIKTSIISNWIDTITEKSFFNVRVPVILDFVVSSSTETSCNGRQPRVRYMDTSLEHAWHETKISHKLINIYESNLYTEIKQLYLFPRTLCSWIIVSYSSKENRPLLISGLR